MEEAILMATSLLVGTGAGALLVHARDRSLLRLYGQLVADLRRKIQGVDDGPPEPPVTRARIGERTALAEVPFRRVS